MSSNLDSSPFLALPIEIRLKILDYVLLSTPRAKFSDTNLSPTVIPMSHPPSRYQFWGKESMSRIFRINRQIYEEAMTALYSGNFEFLFPLNVPKDVVKGLLARFGDRPRGIIARIGVRILIDLKEDWDSTATEASWMLLKRGLTGLWDVQAEIVFTNLAKNTDMERRLADALVKALDIWESVNAARRVVVTIIIRHPRYPTVEQVRQREGIIDVVKEQRARKQIIAQ